MPDVVTNLRLKLTSLSSTEITLYQKLSAGIRLSRVLFIGVGGGTGDWRAA